MRDRVIDVLNEVGARFLQLLERLIVRASLVPTTPFLDPATLPWVRTLEDNWKAIRGELDDVLPRRVLPSFYVPPYPSPAMIWLTCSSAWAICWISAAIRRSSSLWSTPYSNVTSIWCSRISRITCPARAR